MSQGDANDTRDYWKGRYLESVESRKQSDELVKQLFSQMRSQQGPGTPIVVTGGSPTMTQMSSAIAALSSLLMVLFGTYSTATGADIGITMILIGDLRNRHLAVPPDQERPICEDGLCGRSSKTVTPLTMRAGRCLEISPLRPPASKPPLLCLINPPRPLTACSALSEWDDLSDWYDKKQGEDGDLWHRALIDPVLLRLIGEPRGRDILDLGCGNGYLSRRLARQGGRITAVDSSLRMIENARSHDPGDSLKIAYLHTGRGPVG